MIAYHVTGTIQAGLFLLTIASLSIQLRLVLERSARKKAGVHAEDATALLSIRFFSGSFLTFLAFLAVGASTAPFAHYLVWTRLPACLLSLYLIHLIAAERRDRLGALFVGGGMCALIAIFACVCAAPALLIKYNPHLQVGALIAGGVLVTTQLHQLKLIRKAKEPGALSISARSLTLCKDISTIAFALALGLRQSGALLVVAAANALVTAMVVFELAKYSKNKGAAL